MPQTPEELNARYGAPGRIVFREGPGGHPIAVLAAPNGYCEISLYGGHVLSYRAKGYLDALWLSPTAEYADGKAIRGGIPVCWPWFGSAPEGFPPGVQTHGFARRTLWRVTGSSYAAADCELTLELDDGDATHPAWPYRYQLTMTVTVGDSLRVDLQTRNLDRVPFTYSEALHAYLRVADATAVTLIGPAEKPLTFTDAAPYDVIHPTEHGLAVIRDPIMERNLNVIGEDASAFIVWQPPLENGIGDIPPGGSKKFLCVEPANPHQQGLTPITLAPGRAHTLTLRIQPTELK